MNKDKRQIIQSMNKDVWKRDAGLCVLCNSNRIVGIPGVAGAHHILGRNRPDSNQPRHCCLLCQRCHDDSIHTVKGRGRCLTELQRRYDYEYDDRVHWYIEQYMIKENTNSVRIKQAAGKAL